jgi:hypothetical protein
MGFFKEKFSLNSPFPENPNAVGMEWLNGDPSPELLDALKAQLADLRKQVAQHDNHWTPEDTTLEAKLNNRIAQVEDALNLEPA